jgi:hypothetical protein
VVLRKLLLVVWAAAMLPLGAYTSAVHLLALPQPSQREIALAPWSSLVGPRRGVVHVLYASCKCSGRIVDVLTRRHALTSAHEVVMLVGSLGERERELTAAGFEVTHVESENLKRRYHVEAAPLLVVVGEHGEVLYSGGYRASENGPIADAQIIRDTFAGGTPGSLPLFGCAVSSLLRRIVDPLGLKS